MQYNWQWVTLFRVTLYLAIFWRFWTRFWTKMTLSPSNQASLTNFDKGKTLPWEGEGERERYTLTLNTNVGGRGKAIHFYNFLLSFKGPNSIWVRCYTRPLAVKFYKIVPWTWHFLTFLFSESGDELFWRQSSNLLLLSGNWVKLGDKYN